MIEPAYREVPSFGVLARFHSSIFEALQQASLQPGMHPQLDLLGATGMVRWPLGL